ncbi:MAG: AmmeMemoRadiSam system protein A [Bacteroidota bacterium]
MDLNEDEKRELLRIARSSIESTVRRLKPERLSSLPIPLQTPCGAFATLRIDKELRGCVGYVEGRFPLAQTVQEVASKAATQDPRFFPISELELDAVEIEISVLSPLEKVQNIQEIVIGKHGLVIESGYRRGLLLPQVAEEFHLDREQFLSHTAAKAGLPSDVWRQPGVQIYRFTVEKFSESEFSVTSH